MELKGEEIHDVYNKNKIINYNKNEGMNYYNKKNQNITYEYEQYNILNKYKRRRYNKFTKKTNNKMNIINKPYFKNNSWVYNKDTKYNPIFNKNYQLDNILKPFRTVKKCSLKKIKNIGKLRNPIKLEKIEENETNLQRYLNIYELYNKRKHLCFIWFGRLRRLFKKKKNKKKKHFLWKTLTWINANVNDKKKDNNINEQFNSIRYNIYNKKKKKSVFYKFFNNRLYSCIIKNRLKLTEEKNYNSILLNIEKKNFFLNYWIFLRECVSFNHCFHIYNYNDNYWLNFYEVIKNTIIWKIHDVLTLQNSYLYWLPHIFLYKEKKEYNNTILQLNTHTVDIDNIWKEYKIQNDIYMYQFIRKKKWNKKHMYRWSLKRLKQMIAINIKVQIRFNEYNLARANKYEYNSQQNYILDYSKYQMSKKWHLFFNYIQKYVSFNKFMSKRTSINNKYVVKKYYFVVSFIQIHLLKIFNYLKYCYFVNNNSNKLQYFMYKLKLFVFMKLLRKLSGAYTKLPIFSKREQAKLIKNKFSMVRLLFFYIKIIKNKQKIMLEESLNKKNPYLIKEVELKKDVNDRFFRKDSDRKYKQPFFVFKYNPALNPKHAEYVDRQKKKKKGTINYLNRVIRGVVFKYNQKRLKENKRKQKIKQLILSLDNDKKVLKKKQKNKKIVIKNKWKRYQKRIAIKLKKKSKKIKKSRKNVIKL